MTKKVVFRISSLKISSVMVRKIVNISGIDVCLCLLTRQDLTQDQCPEGRLDISGIDVCLCLLTRQDFTQGQWPEGRLNISGIDVCLCLLTRQDLTQGQWPEGRLNISGIDVCLYLPPDRTWHKVNDPKVDWIFLGYLTHCLV